MRIGAHRKRPAGLALISLLACGLAPVALARADVPAPARPTAAMPARPANEMPDRTLARNTPTSLPPETPLGAAGSPAPPIAAVMGPSYVDPAGGHRPIRPIEISTPYHVR